MHCLETAKQVLRTWILLGILIPIIIKKEHKQAWAKSIYKKARPYRDENPKKSRNKSVGINELYATKCNEH